jgi:hypothetical protein
VIERVYAIIAKEVGRRRESHGRKAGIRIDPKTVVVWKDKQGMAGTGGGQKLGETPNRGRGRAPPNRRVKKGAAIK